MRDFGSVRIPPTILEGIPIDFPFDVLPDVAPKFEGESPFHLGLESEYRVYQLVSDLNYSGLWSSIPIELEENINFSVFPNTDTLAPTLLYNPTENISLIEREIDRDIHYLVYDYSQGEFTNTIESGIIRFFDVPDEVLIEIIPDTHTPDIVSQTI